MKALKVLSIIGIVVSAIAFIVVGWSYERDVIAGWGIIACIYLLALSIVVLIQSNKQIIKTIK